MKKAYISLWAIVAIAVNIKAQSIERQVIGSGGQTVSNSSLIVCSTVGEPIVETFTSGTLTLHQGYQQALGAVTSVASTEIEANYKLYPNPATNSTTLELTSIGSDADLSIEVYSLEGKLIYSKFLQLSGNISTVETIDLSEWNSGVYYIHVLDSNSNLSKVIQLVKQ